MSRGVNKVILIGNLGRDPESGYTQAGAAVCKISIGTNDKWTDKQSGETVERTEWHRVVLFNKLAEICQLYLKKGQQVYIEGRIQTRKWLDKDGSERYTTEVVASEMQMLGGKPSADRPALQNSSIDSNPANGKTLAADYARATGAGYQKEKAED